MTSRKDLFASMHRDALSFGFDAEIARRLASGGEYELATREYFAIARKCKEFKLIWEEQLNELNTEFSEYSYARKRMGYPLSWED